MSNTLRLSCQGSSDKETEQKVSLIITAAGYTVELSAGLFHSATAPIYAATQLESLPILLPIIQFSGLNIGDFGSIQSMNLYS